jgi:hypothetical protein
VAIGHDPRLFVQQDAHEPQPRFTVELNIYPEDVMDRAKGVFVLASGSSPLQQQLWPWV